MTFNLNANKKFMKPQNCLDNFETSILKWGRKWFFLVTLVRSYYTMKNDDFSKPIFFIKRELCGNVKKRPLKFPIWNLEVLRCPKSLDQCKLKIKPCSNCTLFRSLENCYCLHFGHMIKFRATNKMWDEKMFQDSSSFSQVG
jgi:hypothetical protein